MSKKKRGNQYKEANEAFLVEKSKEEGVVVLESGIMYRRLKEGHGTKRPSVSGVVYVNYTGRLIDGTVFDTTNGHPLPALFTIRDLIMGFQVALVRMRAGDVFEVYIPAKWGYGSMKLDGIPPHSTLLFEIELVKIERV